MTEPDVAPPTETEKALFHAVLRAGRVSLREVMEQDAAAAARLLELGLLVHYQVDGWVAAVNPRTVGARLGATLREHATGLLARADRVAGDLGELAESYDSAQRRARPGPGITHVASLEQIQHRLLVIEDEYREEGLAAQPGPRPPEFLDDDSRMRKALARGVTADVLYQPVSRDTAHTACYAAAATDWGVRVRVLDEPFTRMLIFDRRVAVIPAAADNAVAAFVEDPVVVDHLVAVFQRDFARAARVPWHDLTGRQLPETARRIGELLATGLTQRAVATRLGLSERTVAAHIARLRERYGAETLFQLGWLMRDGAR
ncbi:LuxR C-terminal-related transcriptional regulator [Kitasatospora cheerisanensis]|uniref:LuxR family transcriptional regulator n=1 Tax=Kitasatospora cheerisanensis KCTC 2395 TaxID=1348663 RepID=A0A066YVQ5_9ACTN|nr:LuxR C-terminal-related transcriptional regulator [Kitasatospora cheerisanensis]KDN84069.1 LuxR family transcriptional regulator [Kitasatospora cheerisanensis KCTC 2395]